MAIINQAHDRSIAERHFRTGPCPPALIFIAVGLRLRHVWHTLSSNMTHGFYMHTKKALMQNMTIRICTKIHNDAPI